MNIEEKIAYWLDLAEYDIETAKVMLDTRRLLYVGFMCHQVIEKAIKAYYWYINNIEPPYTHNIIMLSEKAGLQKLLSVLQKNFLNQVMPLNIEARYPTDKEKLAKTLNYQKAEEIYHQTEDFLKWIKTLLK